MQRKFSFALKEFYHIYNRGTDKRLVYLDDADYSRFLALLYLCNGTASINIREQFPKGLPFVDVIKFERGDELAAICAYCLMPNHFHLLLRETAAGGISRFISKLSTSYSMYFNKKYGRSGRLFENTFKAVHIERDEHLKYLLSYIHLNPVRNHDQNWREDGISERVAAKNYLYQYRYSSYRDFVGEERIEQAVLNKKVLPAYFVGLSDFDTYVNHLLNSPALEVFPKGNPLGLAAGKNSLY